jgi:hypothetical protein
VPDDKNTDMSRPVIDSFTVADFAEAINGKLYVMGGGIGVMFAPTFPHQVRVSIAAILRVPWGDTNRRFPIRAWLENSDGDELEYRLEGQIEAGRPAGGRGEDVIICFAAPLHFTAESTGRFRLVLQFGEDERKLALQVGQISLPPQMQLPT